MHTILWHQGRHPELHRGSDPILANVATDTSAASPAFCRSRVYAKRSDLLMPAAKVTDAEIIARYQGGTSMRNIPAADTRIRRVLEANGIPIDLRRRYLDEVKVPPTPQPKPLTLERRPSVKQRPALSWIADVAEMTKGKLDTLPRPLPEGASRLRVKLYERRRQEEATR